MNIFLKLIKHPVIGARYIKKYVVITVRKVMYVVCKIRRQIPELQRQNKALKETRVRSAEELYLKWKLEMGRAYIPQESDEILQKLKNDSIFLERVLRQADAVLNNSFYILYQRVDNRQSSDGHYRWFEDYRTGYKYKRTFYMNSRAKNRSHGTDIKRIWEMARMQYLLAPALAFSLTGKERYADKVKSILMDFSCQNPKYEGPNWNPSMEIGIRAANIVLALELIQNAPCVDAAFVQDMVGLLTDHAEAIMENEENISEKTSNHYLGGILGLAAISTHLPFLRSSRKTAEYVFRSLNREIQKQILDDGGDYEGSTSYHRLVGELLGFSLLANQNAGFVYSKTSLDRLYSMATFVVNVSSVRDIAVQIGDNDSGRVFQLFSEDPCDFRFMVNLISAICQNSVQSSAGLELLEILFGKQLPKENILCRERHWLATQFGIGRISDDVFDLMVACVNSQKYGMGGHTHNDVGSFTLNIKGFSVIVDPGSGNYTGNPELRNEMRSIDSHSAVKLNGLEPRVSHVSGLFAWDELFGEVSLKKVADGFEALVTQNDIIVRRVFSLKENIVCVKDGFMGSVSFASMKLIFAPGISVTVLDSYHAEIHGVFGKLILSGTWQIKLIESFYSQQYDMIENTKALFLTSEEKNNWLTIRRIM